MISKKIKKIAKEVISSIGCEKCFLFGSHARGDNMADSDYDFLVITKETFTGREKIKLASYIRGKFADKGIDADIIIKSHDEMEYYRNKTGHIVKHALAEGVPAW